MSSAQDAARVVGNEEYVMTAQLIVEFGKATVEGLIAGIEADPVQRQRNAIRLMAEAITERVDTMTAEELQRTEKRMQRVMREARSE